MRCSEIMHAHLGASSPIVSLVLTLVFNDNCLTVRLHDIPKKLANSLGIQSAYEFSIPACNIIARRSSQKSVN